MMNICIIGGGLSGLTAAYNLIKTGLNNETVNVTIFEKNNKLGGCLSSSPAGSGYIEDFYHHCFSGDKHLFELCKDLSIFNELEWLSGSTGYFVNGKIYPLTTPIEILKYPHLSIMDKFRLARLTLKAKKIDVESYDDTSAMEYILSSCGENAYRSFFEPLLNGKFGKAKDKVSAAWLLSRIAIRSDRKTGGEKLGYFKGGYVTLINALEKYILNKSNSENSKILLNSPVTEMTRQDNGIWLINGEEFDAVISTINPTVLEKIAGIKIFDEHRIHYQGAACMTLALPREVTGGIYWLNIKDDAPYGAVIGHTNFVSPTRYGGEHIVYLASYFCGKPAENLESDMITDFCAKFGVKKDEIIRHNLTIEEFAGPLYTRRYKKLIPLCDKLSDMKIFLAGMFSINNYPERSMEGSIRAGEDAALAIISKYQNLKM